MIRVTHKGNFNHTEKFFNLVKGRGYLNSLAKYGDLGVEALAKATPKDSGLTADSWSFDIQYDQHKTSITWYNSNVNRGVNVAIILQYGHATGTGGYVAGRDYINPAIQPIFDQIAEDVWKEVRST